MVDGMVVKVCGYGIRGHIIRRMLYRGEGVNILPQRQYNDTAGMLTGTASHSGTSGSDTVDLAGPLMNATFFKIILHITESGLIRQGCNGSGTESLSCTEDNLRVFMRLDWYSPEKFRSISGSLSPLNPRNVSKGISKPSL